MTTIAALPTPPSRADSPTDFSSKADALLGALPTFVTETNAVASEVNTAKNNAATSEANAATSAGTATSAASTATSAANAAAASYDAFDDRYLGSFAANPTLDNDGNALLIGALYWNTAATELRVWTGSTWVGCSVPGGVIPVSSGGTGATTADAALVALGERTAITGSAKMPVGTTAQRDVTPQSGYLRYNSETDSFEGYKSGAWGSIGGGATGAGGDTIFQENKRVMTTSYTLSTNTSASMVGPLTINSGVTLTIPTGQRLVVL